MSFKRTFRQLKKDGILTKLFWLVIIVVPLAFVLTGGFSKVSTLLFSRAANSQDEFVKTDGYNLTYRGVNVALKGVNFDNISALAGTIGTTNDHIGSGDVNDIYFTEQDYQRLGAAGGNHVRLGMSYQWWRDQRQDFYRQIDQQVAWARKHNVWISLLNFTNPNGDGNDDCYEGYSEHCPMWTNKSYQADLLEFWKDIANRYKNEPAVVGYDLVNEPTPPGPGWCNTWFDIAQDMSVQVSDVAPNQLIFIEACSDPAFYRIFKDKNGNKATNVVYEVHDYEPMAFTHTGYNPSPSKIKTYPGNASTWVEGVEKTIYFDLDTMLGKRYSDYSTAKQISIDWAKNNNVPIYVGEWGAQGWTNGYDQYIRDKATVYNQLGVSHAFYTWKHDINEGWWWGIYSRNGNDVDQVKLDAVKTSWVGAIKPQFGESTTPLPSPSPSPVPTPSPSPKPNVTPSPTPLPSPEAPVSNGEYPKTLSTSNDQIQFVESQPAVGNEIFVKAVVGSGINVSNVEWYVNDAWQNRERSDPYYLGGDDNGTPKGFDIGNGDTQLRAVVYYDNGERYIDAYTNYRGGDLATAPSPTPQVSAKPDASPRPSPSPIPTPSPTPQVSPRVTPAPSPSPEPSATPARELTAYVDIFDNWETGYCARVVVNNNTNQEIKNWLIGFNLNEARFTSKWNGRFINLFGRIVVIPNGDTKWLPAKGRNSTVDWCATKTGSNWAPSDIEAVAY